MKFKVTERITVEHFQHASDGRELPDATGRTYFRIQLAPMTPMDDRPWRNGYVGLELTSAEAERFRLWIGLGAIPIGLKRPRCEPFLETMGKSERPSRPPLGIVAMRFSVQRLEATRDRLNPMLALTRSVDANLDDLREWRQRREVERLERLVSVRRAPT